MSVVLRHIADTPANLQRRSPDVEAEDPHLTGIRCEQAQQSLGDIRSAAAKLGDLMKEVAKSATEQANAAGEITRVANDMARMTEEFSSSSQAGRESGNQVIRAMDKAATITRESLEQIELLGKSAVELEDQAREIQRLM